MFFKLAETRDVKYCCGKVGHSATDQGARGVGAPQADDGCLVARARTLQADGRLHQPGDHNAAVGPPRDGRVGGSCHQSKICRRTQQVCSNTTMEFSFDLRANTPLADFFDRSLLHSSGSFTSNVAARPEQLVRGGGGGCYLAQRHHSAPYLSRVIEQA
jgi:hypothetical protein